MIFETKEIVFCTPAIYTAGGVERVVVTKANYFVEQLGYSVTIVVTEGKGRDSFFPLSDKVRVTNFELGFEDLWKATFLQKYFLFLKKQFTYKKLLRAELMRIRPDFTISTLRREINFLTNFKDGSIKIGELHVNRANYRRCDLFKYDFLNRMFNWYWMKNLLSDLHRLDRMVVLTENAFNDWLELDNVVMIPDPLPFRVDKKSHVSHKRIVSIGRYAYDKGNDILLQIWSKVEKQIDDWELDIYGNGNREPYMKLARQLGIDETRCHLYGAITDVKKEYLNSSIFVLPSRFEGFGLVLIEAMACGVPVVSFDCDNGPRSIVTNGEDGFLVPLFDINIFAERIIQLINNENLRKTMGEKGQHKAKQYDIDIIGKQWQQLFDELKQ